MVSIPTIEKIELNNINIIPDYYIETLMSYIDDIYDFETKIYKLLDKRFYSINITHVKSNRLICKLFPYDDDCVLMESCINSEDEHQYYRINYEEFEEFVINELFNMPIKKMMS